MPGSFQGIEIASRALSSFQKALDVTGHNVSNVNTPGYTRQTVEFATTDPTTFFSRGRQALGTGVTISSVNRIRDMFLDARMQAAQGDLGSARYAATSYKMIQQVFNEPGEAGISNALDAFFNAWSGLASNPSDTTARVAVQTAGQTLTSRIRGTYQSLSELNAQQEYQIEGIVKRINDLADNIDRLNKEIRAQQMPNITPNDLLDRRDQAIQELSGLVNVTTQANSDGTMSVFISQFSLVDQSGVRTFPSTYDASTGRFSDSHGYYDIRSGELSGVFKTMNQISLQMGKLDLMANTLRTEVNALHQTGANPNGTTGINFFNDVTPPAPQTGAIDFDLSFDVLSDANNISNSAVPLPSGEGTPGDGGLALAISRLREASNAALGGKKFQDFHSDTILQLGSDTAYFVASLDTQEAVVNQIESQRQSVSGVSLDDEMANMLRFQRSYQAAAKMLTIFDQTTEDLLNMIRR